MERITASYIRDLACIYHKIDNRGLLFDETIMQELRYDISNKITTMLEEFSFKWNCLVYTGANASKKKIRDSVNIGSPDQLLTKLKLLGYDIPKVRKRNKNSRDWEYKDSVEELVLRKLFAETNSQDIKSLLEIRELTTLLGRYVNSSRLKGVFYSCYNTAGTITGRRGCKKHIFGLGGNAQTLPKHYLPESACYNFGHKFLEGVISRPGKLFFIVDQMSAEDWPTNALAENTKALDELSQRVDRHTNLASFIFNIPVGQRTPKEWKDSIERYLGKKSRHAFNYGMRGSTMSDSLAKEGFSLSPEKCDEILSKVDEYDPSIERTFHKYIRESVLSKQMLQTPFGRERHFFGLRQNNSNYQIFNEAYSYIPQSTVGDNTGFGVYSLEHGNGSGDIVNESHDSISQEIADDLQTILCCYERTKKAFNRPIIFHNGITINIPIEGELGFNLGNTIKIKDFTEQHVKTAYEQLKDTQ